MKNTTFDRREAHSGFETHTLTSNNQADSGGTSQTVVDDYALARIDFRVKCLKSQFDLSKYEQEDLRHDMIVELLAAFRRFDPAKAKRETFINRVLDRFVKYVTRIKCTRLRRPSDSPAKFEDIHVGFQPAVNDPGKGERDEMALRELRLDLMAAMDGMPERLRRVCVLLMEFSPAEAAKQLGIHCRSIYRIIADIREYLQEAGFGNFENQRDKSGPAADVEGAQEEKR